MTKPARTFDGTNDYYQRATPTTISGDSDTGTIAFWMKTTAADVGNNLSILRIDEDPGAPKVLFHGVNGAGGTYNFRLQTSGAAILYNANSNKELDDGVWHSILLSWNLDATPEVHFFIDDVDGEGTVFTAPQEGEVGWGTAEFTIGARFQGDRKYEGDLAQMYINEEFIDFSVEANRKLFHGDLQGSPNSFVCAKELLSDGSGPTSSQPPVFMIFESGAGNINSGDGGDFTTFGAPSVTTGPCETDVIIEIDLAVMTITTQDVTPVIILPTVGETVNVVTLDAQIPDNQLIPVEAVTVTSQDVTPEVGLDVDTQSVSITPAELFLPDFEQIDLTTINLITQDVEPLIIVTVEVDLATVTLTTQDLNVVEEVQTVLIDTQSIVLVTKDIAFPIDFEEFLTLTSSVLKTVKISNLRVDLRFVDDDTTELDVLKTHGSPRIL